jgi:hypothetical protein
LTWLLLRVGPAHACLPACLQQRQVGKATLLEATLENATAAPMLLEAVTFFPGPAFSEERIPQNTAGPAALAPGEGPLRCVELSINKR